MPSNIRLRDYATKYPNVRIEREGGILLLRLHTDEKSLVWTIDVHDSLPYLFTEIASDPENRCVLITGTGDAFCDALDHTTFNTDTPRTWDNILYEGQRLLNNLMAINVPVISAVNGPARFHPEMPAMSDIVLASDTAIFRDHHFVSGTVPGDGCHVVWTHILGPNRGRYFLITGQELSAKESLAAGVVSEVLKPADLMSRAWELAKHIASKPPLVCRYTRQVLTARYRQLLADGVGTGLALQGIAKMDKHFPG